jgi:Ca2+-binding RTX toxin-like protein
MTIITGTSGDDTLTGTSASDIISGLAGNDIVYGGGGGDQLYGGDGDDTLISGAGGIDTVDGGSGVDLWEGDYTSVRRAMSFTETGPGSYLLSNGTNLAGIEQVNLKLGAGADSVSLDSVTQSVIDGGGGINSAQVDLSGDAQRVSFVVSDQSAGAFNDGTETLELVHFKKFQITTGSGNDLFLIKGVGKQYDIDAGAGVNTAILNLSASHDALTFVYDSAASTLTGGGDVLKNIQDYSLLTGSGDDTLTGGTGTDRLDGGLGHNLVYGGDGDDALSSSGGVDTIYGGSGEDGWTGNYAKATTGLTFNQTGPASFHLSNGTELHGIEQISDLHLGSGDDTVSLTSLGPSASEPDRFYGGHGDNTLSLDLSSLTTAVDVTFLKGFNGFVTSGSQTTSFHAFEHFDLTGGSGDDVLKGAIESDQLNGGAGDDTLIGGAGADQLAGGAGADHFVFLALSDSTPAPAGQDVITDFSSGDGDKIDLSAIDADASTPGNQAFVWAGSAFTSSPGQLIEVAKPGGFLIEGDVTGDGNADLAVFVKASAPLGPSDFIL